MKLYHRTTPEAIAKILETGEFEAKDPDGSVYFSTRSNGRVTSGYGSAYIVVNVPARLCTLDDEFPDGERHYRVNRSDLRREHITRNGTTERKAPGVKGDTVVIKTIEKVEPGPTSAVGNPSYVVTCTDGTVYRTMTDTSDAYGLDSNPEFTSGRPVEFTLTRSGRIRYARKAPAQPSGTNN